MARELKRPGESQEDLNATGELIFTGLILASIATIAVVAEQNSWPLGKTSSPTSNEITQKTDLPQGGKAEQVLSHYQYLAEFLSCAGGSDWCWRDEAEDLQGKKLMPVIFGAAPRMGRVTSPEGLKVRYVPSTSEHLGEGYVAPQGEWKQFMEEVSWELEVGVVDEQSGREEARWAAIYSPVTPQGPEVPKFFALEIDGQKFVDTSEGEPGAVRPRPKIEILASRSGRQLPRSQPPPGTIRSGYSTVVPGPKSSFWAARTSW